MSTSANDIRISFNLFDNLIVRHPDGKLHPSLATEWKLTNPTTWTFKLRQGVKWHDGKPFTAKDVKYTFDVVREAADAPAKLRLNPRKEWYANVEAIEAPEPHTVVFRLKRPQPSLLLMLASGYSPVYPAHVPVADLRQRCMGTGPFKWKEYVRGQSLELERHRDYFRPTLPYLDGVRFLIITDRGTRMAAIQAGRADAYEPFEMTKAMADTLRQNNPSLVITETAQLGSDNVVLNHKRPPFDNLVVRRAISFAATSRSFRTCL